MLGFQSSARLIPLITGRLLPQCISLVFGSLGEGSSCSWLGCWGRAMFCFCTSICPPQETESQAGSCSWAEWGHSAKITHAYRASERGAVGPQVHPGISCVHFLLSSSVALYMSSMLRDTYLLHLPNLWGRAAIKGLTQGGFLPASNSPPPLTGMKVALSDRCFQG